MCVWVGGGGGWKSWGNGEGTQQLWKIACGGSSRVRHGSTMRARSHTFGVYPREMKIHIHVKICARPFTVVQSITAQSGHDPMLPLMHKQQVEWLRAGMLLSLTEVTPQCASACKTSCSVKSSIAKGHTLPDSTYTKRLERADQ